MSLNILVIKPYACGSCGKGFVQANILKLHEFKHTGNKPYVCGTLGKGFIQAYILKLHEFKHTGNKPYACRICGTCFTIAGHLEQHVKNYSVEVPDLFVFVFVALRPISTAMVIAGRSVHLTTLFPWQAWASG